MAKIGELEVDTLRFANGSLAEYHATTGGIYAGGTPNSITATLSDSRDRPCEVFCYADWTWFDSTGSNSGTFYINLKRNRGGSYTTFASYTFGAASNSLSFSVCDADSQDGDIWYLEVYSSLVISEPGTTYAQFNERRLAVKVSRF